MPNRISFKATPSPSNRSVETAYQNVMMLTPTSSGRSVEHHHNEDTSAINSEAIHTAQDMLCARCSTIDFETLLAAREIEGFERKLLNLGQLGEELKTSTCSLCRLFEAVKTKVYSHQTDATYALNLVIPLYYPGQESMLAVVTDQRPDLTKTSPERIELAWSTNDELIACSVASKRRPVVPSARARTNDAGRIDFDILRGWVRNCTDKHTGWGCETGSSAEDVETFASTRDRQNLPLVKREGIDNVQAQVYKQVELCNQTGPSVSELKDFTLIDCEDRRLVPALPSYSYSALSYVWGAKGSQAEVSSLEHSLPETLHQTIEDAIHVTKELGIRYIWIDRYCIDQNDFEKKKAQVRLMDVVYQNAFITLIAAAGDNPRFGLPGVGAKPRLPQATAQVGDTQFVSILHDPRHLIRGSKWMTRAWTYQESYFSRRRLVFTEKQVYFECHASVAWETLEPITESTSDQVFKVGNDELCEPWDICRELCEYSGKELSIEGDAVSAFEGIFNSFGRNKYPVRQYYGVPIMPSTTEKKPLIFGRESCSGPRRRSDAFAAGLCWSHHIEGTRRGTFPSWSWAGWTVPIQYQQDFCEMGLGNDRGTPLKIFAENSEGLLLDLDDFDDGSLDQTVLDSFARAIHVEAWTIPIDLQDMPGTLYDGTEASYRVPCAVFSNGENPVIIPVQLLDRTSTNDLVSRRHDLFGIVFGRCEDLQGGYDVSDVFVMIIINKGDRFERIGHLDFLGFMFHFPRDRDQADGLDTITKFVMETCFRYKERRRIRLA